MRDMLQKILVDTKVVKPEMIYTSVRGTSQIRGIVRAMHPFGKNANCAIVIAFTETNFKHYILERVSNPKLEEVSMGNIKIEPHPPQIINDLRHEGVFARKKLVQVEQDKAVSYVVSTFLKSPWVRLIKVEKRDGRATAKTVIPFELKDYRLAQPELYHSDSYMPLPVLKKRNQNQPPPKFVRKADTKTIAVPLGQDGDDQRVKYEWESGGSEDEMND